MVGVDVGRYSVTRWARVFVAVAVSLPLIGCFATVSELKKEESSRKALEAEFSQFKREQRERVAKLEDHYKGDVVRLKAELAKTRAELARSSSALKELKGTVQQGQGGVAEMFTTMQKLQENFQKSLGQVDELQQTIKDVLQKQPEQEKKYQEIQKRYEELLRNQKMLAEQAIPAKLFARARDAYKAEKLDEAMKDFQKFTQNFGSHPLADNAFLYIGDIHRKRKEFSAALIAYNTIIKKYPNESEVPRALLRLGLLSYQEGQCQTGRRYFLQLSRYRRQEPKLAEDGKQFYRGYKRFCKRRR